MYLGKTRFKYESRAEGSNVFRVRVKATVRKDGSVLSQYPAEYREGDEWRECTAMNLVRANGSVFPPEKGKPFLSVCTLGMGAVLCLYDPNPTFEGEDGEEESRSEG